jgi:hypothetical protein
MPIPIIYTTALILVIGVFPLPYGYYMLLRLVVTSVFIWAAMTTCRKGKSDLMWVCIVVALLFNPIFKVHLINSIWVGIDIITAVFLIVIREQIKATDATT